jgi:hypothetical protein
VSNRALSGGTQADSHFFGPVGPPVLIGTLVVSCTPSELNQFLLKRHLCTFVSQVTAKPVQLNVSGTGHAQCHHNSFEPDKDQVQWNDDDIVHALFRWSHLCGLVVLELAQAHAVTHT